VGSPRRLDGHLTDEFHPLDFLGVAPQSGHQLSRASKHL
jgi:hypothetical protein